MIEIDGSEGEGGGQILRTALALSMVTARPFRIERIRAGRSKPGLLRQHLAAVRAAVQVSGADAEGAELGSKALAFTPRTIRGGAYTFAVGSAGSATLVLQTVLPALLQADGPSTLALEGGTHNPMAPPFDFLKLTFLPLLAKMGAQVEVELERPGFYPAGGGRFVARIRPCTDWNRLELTERGAVRDTRGRALVANLPASIAERELHTVQRRLGLNKRALKIEDLAGSLGPGNVVVVEVESANLTEVFCAFGEKDTKAERVAEKACNQVRKYLKAGVPVGGYLADQLMLPLALGRGGVFHTVPLTPHGSTNLETIAKFIDLESSVTPLEGRNVRVEINRRG